MPATHAPYTIRVDANKNRLYLTLRGFWRTPDEVGSYEADFKKALSQLKPKFTILADLREFLPSGAAVAPMHAKVQGLAVAAGLTKTAEVLSSDNAISKMATNNYARQSGMKRGAFGSIAEAETWLAQA